MTKTQNRDANNLRWQKSASLGIRVPGPEYRKMQHRETLWWGCCCKKSENHYVSRRWHPSFNLARLLRLLDVSRHPLPQASWGEVLGCSVPASLSFIEGKWCRDMAAHAFVLAARKYINGRRSTIVCACVPIGQIRGLDPNSIGISLVYQILGYRLTSLRSSFILRITFPQSSVTPPLAGPSGRRPPGMWRSPEPSPGSGGPPAEYGMDWINPLDS